MMSNQAGGPRRTLKDREELMPDPGVTKSGFRPRPIQKLAVRRLPKSTLNIECNHFLRSSTEEATHGHPSLTYQLWLEAGKHEAPFPDKPDPQYNSNVWRNFRQSYGFHMTSEGQKIGEMIANMYPLNIPAPSRVKQYTYAKFLRETPLIHDPKMKRVVLEQVERDLSEFRRLRLHAETRDPPLDKSGTILPPANFKKYEPRFIPPDDPLPLPEPPKGETRVDIFGKRVPKLRHTPFLWKVSYRLNNPSFKKSKEEKTQKEILPPQHPPAITTVKVTH